MGLCGWGSGDMEMCSVSSTVGSIKHYTSIDGAWVVRRCSSKYLILLSIQTPETGAACYASQLLIIPASQ